ATLRGNTPFRPRYDAELLRLRAKCRTMIERMTGFILPLMHHLVQQCVQGLLPAVPSEMSHADRDLADAATGRRIVPEAAFHAARHPHRYGAQRAAEQLTVVARVPLGELGCERLVFRTHRLATRRRRGSGVDDLERHDLPLRHASLGAR